MLLVMIKLFFSKTFLILKFEKILKKEVAKTRESYSPLCFHRYFDILDICFQDICSGIFKVY